MQINKCKRLWERWQVPHHLLTRRCVICKFGIYRSNIKRDIHVQKVKVENSVIDLFP